jgi:hypothetical protein
MSDEKSTDKIARGIAIFSLIVAIAAVTVPYMQQRSQFQVLQNEELAVRLNPSTHGPLRITEYSLGPIGHVVQIPWQLALSNTGNQNLSIIKYSIAAGVSPNSIDYSGLDGGMFHSNQKRVDLPYTISPGESQLFVVLVGILVPPEVYEILLSAQDSNSSTVGNFKLVLAKHGLDLYGNEVSYQEFEGGNHLITVEKANDKSPTYWYQAVSGRGNVFMSSATAYSWPK